jgi:hypothetical protein
VDRSGELKQPVARSIEEPLRLIFENARGKTRPWR